MDFISLYIEYALKDGCFAQHFPTYTTYVGVDYSFGGDRG